MKKSLQILIIILTLIVIGYLIILESKDEQLVGGCAGVAPWYIQECCDNWARENNIVKIQCVGEWEIEDNKCNWKCASEDVCIGLNESECMNYNECAPQYIENEYYHCAH